MHRALPSHFVVLGSYSSHLPAAAQAAFLPVSNEEKGAKPAPFPITIGSIGHRENRLAARVLDLT
ncbi:MAG: hypothetical protein WCF35_21610, partial [Pseudolabrys sp.]